MYKHSNIKSLLNQFFNKNCINIRLNLRTFPLRFFICCGKNHPRLPKQSHLAPAIRSAEVEPSILLTLCRLICLLKSTDYLFLAHTLHIYLLSYSAQCSHNSMAIYLTSSPLTNKYFNVSRFRIKHRPLSTLLKKVNDGLCVKFFI